MGNGVGGGIVTFGGDTFGGTVSTVGDTGEGDVDGGGVFDATMGGSIWKSSIVKYRRTPRPSWLNVAAQAKPAPPISRKTGTPAFADL